MPPLKRSKQREAIKNYLQCCDSHPTADTVYDSLRKEFPNISLGTVYRNLSLLAELGEINRISAEDGADHFDGDTHPHNHFICKCCHRIYDLEMDSADMVVDLASKNFSGRIDSYLLNFYGICLECIKEKNSGNNT